jgi:hypothetical protein
VSVERVRNFQKADGATNAGLTNTTLAGTIVGAPNGSWGWEQFQFPGSGALSEFWRSDVLHVANVVPNSRYGGGTLPPAREGFYMARFELIDDNDGGGGFGNQRAQIHGGITYSEGMERYFGFSIFIPSDWTERGTGTGFHWNIPWQLHHFPGSGQAPINLILSSQDAPGANWTNNSNVRWAIGWNTGTDPNGFTYSYTPIAALTKGIWTNFVVHVVFSTNAAVGLTEVWIGGNKLFSQHHATLYPGSSNYEQYGAYRESGISGSQVHYIQSVRVATTFAEADPASYTSSPPPTPAPTSSGLVSTLGTVTSPARTAGTVGQSAQGSGWGSMGTNFKFVRKITVGDTDVDLKNVKMVVDGNRAAGTTATKWKALLFADNSGVPGALTATGTEQTIALAAAAATQTSPFSAAQRLTRLTSYWIGFHADSGNAGRFASTTGSAGSSEYWNTDTYADGATDPFGTGTAGVASVDSIWGDINLVASATSSVSLSFDPTLVFFQVTDAGLEGLGSLQALGFGWAISGFQCSSSYQSLDNQATQATSRAMHGTSAIMLVGSAGTWPNDVVRGTVTLRGGGFDVAWDTTDTRAHVVQWLAFGGSDLRVASGTFVASTAAPPVNQDITGLSFTPSAVLAMNARFAGALPGGANGVKFGLGVGVSSTKRAGIAVSAGSANPSSVAQWQADDSFIFGFAATTETADIKGDYVGIANGFRVAWSDTPSTAHNIAWLAINAPFVELLTTPTEPLVTGAQSIPFGFLPDGFMLFGCNAARNTAVDATQQRLSLALSDGVNGSGVWAGETDNVSPTQTNSGEWTSRLFQQRSARTTNDSYSTFTSVDATGATHTWQQVDGVAKEFIAFAIAGNTATESLRSLLGVGT